MLPQKRAFAGISPDNDSNDLTLYDTYSRTLRPSVLPVDRASSPPTTCIVCLGMIQQVEAMLFATSLQHSEITSSCRRSYDHTNYYFQLEWHDEAAFLARSPGSLVATLNKSTCEILNQVMKQASTVIFDLYVSRQSWSKAFRKENNERDAILHVQINVLGDISASKTIGDMLSANKIYLQRPISLKPERTYQNPHHVNFPGITPRTQDIELEDEARVDIDQNREAMVEEETEKEDLKNEFAVVFSSLIRSQCLTELAADRRIRASLLHHQKEALDFIMQREFGPVPPQFSLWENVPDMYNGKACFKHIISETRSYETPLETGGGILADDMGLGKTLTILANIVATLIKAAEFQNGSPTSHPSSSNNSLSHYRSRATLVIVPSHMLIKSWTEEINKHIYGGLRVCEYHGRGRETNIEAIANAEIVLTTYHTLAGESSKTTSPLFKINWFRVVLDEAHIIRTSSTLFFESVTRLEANLRWCVTGTPVQNNLEDLGSLVAFLQVPMLDTRLEFKQHIINPLMRKSGSDTSHLRALLDSVCLRRLNKLLDLPDIDEVWQEIEFSDKERQQYNKAETDMSTEIKRQVNLEKSKRGFFGPLELEMHLRRMCNHGTFEKPRTEEQSQIYESSGGTDSTICDFCKIDLSDEILVNNLCNGHYTACGHLICYKCLPRFEQALATARNSKGRICPLCGNTLPGDYLVLDKAEVMLGPQIQRPLPSFRADGVSSKINALLENLKNTNSRDKSIIFSGWTRTLDLIEQHLKELNVQFRRIDGSSSFPMRTKVLDEFRKNSKIQILMMTTGTGAVGLNLAVASCVHIFEPQWNPMVESQAVARVVRLGQKKKVSVVRYIVRGTVEQTMRSQQQRKLMLASMGWKKDKAT